MNIRYLPNKFCSKVLASVFCFAFCLFMQNSNIFAQDVEDEIKAETNANLVGYWQYPDRLVWIHISENDEAFQCRIAPSNKIFKSKGILKDNKEIVWEEIWGTDTITLKEDKITLQSKIGKFSYIKVDEVSDPSCASPLQNDLDLANGEDGDSKSSVGVGRGQGSGNGSGSGSGSSKPLRTGKLTGLKILSTSPPGYTKEARAKNVYGRVILRVAFLASGKIGAIETIIGLPYGLTEKAIKAAKKTKFEPATQNGVPYSVTKAITFNFSIY